MRYSNAKRIFLDTAVRLFYEQGFKGTSLSDIARLCEITKPAILYHFGSKIELGLAVTEVFTRNQEEGFAQIALERAGETDRLLVSAARTIWIPGYFVRDKKAARFYREFIAVSEFFRSIGKEQESQYIEILSGNNDDPLEDRLTKIGAIYAGKGLLDLFLDGVLDCSVQEFSHYFFLNYYKPIINDRTSIEKLYISALTLLDIIDAKDGPDFEVS